MEFGSLLLRFLHYTDAKMCLSGEELKNDRLGHNKNRINVRILLGWALEGMVDQGTGNLHFFYFANTSRSNLSLNTSIKFIATPHPIQFICDPLPSRLNYCIWFLTNRNQTSPFWVILLSVTFDLLMSHTQNVEKWSRDWRKIFRLSIWAATAQKPRFYIIKQSFLAASPSAFALLSKLFCWSGVRKSLIIAHATFTETIWKNIVFNHNNRHSWALYLPQIYCRKNQKWI